MMSPNVTDNTEVVRCPAVTSTARTLLATAVHPCYRRHCKRGSSCDTGVFCVVGHR